VTTDIDILSIGCGTQALSLSLSPSLSPLGYGHVFPDRTVLFMAGFFVKKYGSKGFKLASLCVRLLHMDKGISHLRGD
jgi:hypothetical protein